MVSLPTLTHAAATAKPTAGHAGMPAKTTVAMVASRIAISQARARNLMLRIHDLGEAGSLGLAVDRDRVRFLRDMVE